MKNFSYQISRILVLHKTLHFDKFKFSLNVKKISKFSIFHKASGRDYLPLVLPKLFINIQVIKRQSSIKFIGILLDENLGGTFEIDGK